MIVSSHPAGDQGLTARELLRIGSRRRWLILLPAIAGLAIAGAVAALDTPSYAANAVVVLDLRGPQYMQVDGQAAPIPREASFLRSELDVIASRSMAERVVDRYGLENRPRFAAPPEPGALDRFLDQTRATLAAWTAGAFGDAAPPPVETDAVLPYDRVEIVDYLLDGLTVSNDGQSYTIDIAFASDDPEFSAEMANAFAEGYLRHQLESRTDAAGQATEWLNARLVELRRQLEASEEAVETYRKEARLLEADGATLVGQQLASLNAQLVAAQADRTQAEARYHTAQRLAQSGAVSSLANVLDSDVIQALRESEAEIEREYLDLKARVTDKHPNLTAVAAELAAVRQQIGREVSRIVQSLENETEAAKSREASIRAAVAELEGAFGDGAQAGVRLRQLEREAAANRDLYESFLSRYKSVLEQERLELVDAKIVSRAEPPALPNGRGAAPILALGLLFGGVAGSGFALLRERLDDRIQSVAQLEALTGLPVLGVLPAVPRRSLAPPHDYVLRKPHSPFAESLRTTRVALHLSRGGDATSVLAVTSSAAGEGKTSFCVALARTLAQEGRRVLLIDADPRRPRVARALKVRGASSIAALFAGETELADVVWKDPMSVAEFASIGSEAARVDALANSTLIARFLELQRDQYDFVVIDTPPIMSAVDAAAISRIADSCVFLVRWNHTRSDAIAEGLRRLALCQVDLAGVVLNRVNLRKYERYGVRLAYPPYLPRARPLQAPPALPLAPAPKYIARWTGGSAE